MSENQAHAGNGPAPSSASTGEKDFTGRHVVPATQRLHAALACCETLIAHLSERAVDYDQFDYLARTKLALAVGRLAQSQAQAAGAIARLADAESRQRLTDVKVDDATFRPRRTRNSGSSNSVTTTGWEEHESESKKSTFNSSGNSAAAFSGPRVREV